LSTVEHETWGWSDDSQQNALVPSPSISTHRCEQGFGESPIRASSRAANALPVDTIHPTLKTGWLRTVCGGVLMQKPGIPSPRRFLTHCPPPVYPPAMGAESIWVGVTATVVDFAKLSQCNVVLFESTRQKAISPGLPVALTNDHVPEIPLPSVIFPSSITLTSTASISLHLGRLFPAEGNANGSPYQCCYDGFKSLATRGFQTERSVEHSGTDPVWKGSTRLKRPRWFVYEETGGDLASGEPVRYPAPRRRIAPPPCLRSR